MENWKEKLVTGSTPLVMSAGAEYNEPPEGLKEIKEEAFSVGTLFSYHIEAIERKQISFNEKWIELLMFWMDNTSGYALSRDTHTGKITYYHFGCEHDYATETIGRCLHKWTCKKCGLQRVVDSSD